MEDILNLYEQPYDALNPLITFDERPCQLIDDVLAPLPMTPSKPKREDYHYQRTGGFITTDNHEWHMQRFQGSSIPLHRPNCFPTAYWSTDCYGLRKENSQGIR